jgi:hypothetical protein
MAIIHAHSTQKPALRRALRTRPVPQQRSVRSSETAPEYTPPLLQLHRRHRGFHQCTVQGKHGFVPWTTKRTMKRTTKKTKTQKMETPLLIHQDREVASLWVLVSSPFEVQALYFYLFLLVSGRVHLQRNQVLAECFRQHLRPWDLEGAMVFAPTSSGGKPPHRDPMDDAGTAKLTTFRHIMSNPLNKDSDICPQSPRGLHPPQLPIVPLASAYLAFRRSN